MKHINSLPDLVLRLIFSKVPLQDLLHLGRVCALWRSYQQDITQQVHSLTLLLGSSSAHSLITKSHFRIKYRDLLLNDDGKRIHSSQNKFSHFTYSVFTQTCAAQLKNNFTQITSLEIAYDNRNLLIGSIVHLLGQLSPVLKSLKMYFQLRDTCDGHPDEFEEFANLLNVINSMPVLEHLTLESVTSICHLLRKPYDYTIFYHIFSFKSMDLPILGRLREFYFYSPDRLNIIEKSLQSYAVPNDNLSQLALDCSLIVPLCESMPQLASKIVHAQFDVSESISPQLGGILQPFSSITKLDIIFSKCTEQTNNQINEPILNCSSLRQLTHLHLDTSSAQYHRSPISPATLSRNLFPRLHSVQVLKLTIATRQAESGLESADWSDLFPNVQVLELVIHCTIRNLPAETTSPFFSECQIHQSLSTFLQCPKLHHIYTCEIHSYYYGLVRCRRAPDLLREWILFQGRDGKIIVNARGHRAGF